MKRITLLLLTLSLLTAVAAQDNDTSPTPQLLTGTLVNTKVNGGAAKLKLGDQGLGFYAVSGATQQNANTAYIAEKRTLLIDLATLDTIHITLTPEEQALLDQLHADPEYQKQLREQEKLKRQQEVLDKKKARAEAKKAREKERRDKERAREQARKDKATAKKNQKR